MYWTHLPKISNKNDRYGFVDEHEIRIATGITLVLGFTSLSLVLLKAEYDIPLFLVGAIWIDFLIKVFISPRFSLFGGFVRLFRKNKTPLWIGSIQKRFAWSIGLFISTFVMFCLLVLGKFITMKDNPVVEWIWKVTAENIANQAIIVVPMNPAIIACVLCLIFMWLESVAWYCVWCSIYGWMVRKWWLKWDKNQKCLDGSCEI
jgi:hypothetical protein